jgi:hypothetical protein
VLDIVICPEPLVSCAVDEARTPFVVAVADTTDADAVKAEKAGSVTPALAQRD